MRCKACNKNLTDREASQKYLNWQEIKDAEERYIGLCDGCMEGTEIQSIHNPFASDKEYEDETPLDEEPENE